jgi:putative copper resistance protein D
MMDSDLPLVIARAVHFASCLLIVSVCWFDLLVMRGQCGTARDSWTKIARWLVLAALPLAALSGAAWFALIVTGMSGFPFSQAMQTHVMGMVWRDTKFGRLWQLRTIFFIALSVSVALRPPKLKRWAFALLGALFLGSLAWSGHGRYGSNRAHLLADSLHLLVAAAWPFGLIPFALMLWTLRRGAQWQTLATVTRRFSALSLFSVAALAATGIVNSCYMLNSPGDLSRTAYGRMLMIKVCIFATAVAVGAVNLLRLKPRMALIDSDPSRPALALQVTTFIEIVCAIAIIAALSVLGTLPPPHE